MTGKFVIVGVGPGDPELITIKAAQAIQSADVIAYHCGVGKQSIARSIASDLIPAHVIEEELRYPVTTRSTTHPGGYAGAIADFYEQCAARLTRHLKAGRRVALLSEGDPMFYGSPMYMHDRLSGLFPTQIIPGVTSVSAATAVCATPLVRQSDVLTILPGTLPEAELARRLANSDGAIIMKLGRTFPAVRNALEQAGRLGQALYVERASMKEQRILPVREVDPGSVPYFSLIVVPSSAGSAYGTPRETSPEPAAHELLVAGIGPGPDDWITPEVTEAVAGAAHLVGYGPYLERIPPRPGQQRHSTGNTVEIDRALHALALARAGERVVVVSGGDAGVFGMAAAVFEVADEFPEVSVRVLPGLSAVQAVAARAGAPVGADFAVMSLSDRLKPWDVIEARLRAIADADFVLAIFNPASLSRTSQISKAKQVLLEHRPAETIVVVGRDIGRQQESLTVTSLSELDPSAIDMKCLLIVGSSQTRRSASGRVWTSRSVPS